MKTKEHYAIVRIEHEGDMGLLQQWLNKFYQDGFRVVSILSDVETFGTVHHVVIEEAEGVG